MSKDDYITDFEKENKGTINELRSRINLFKTNKDSVEKGTVLIDNSKPFIENAKPFSHNDKPLFMDNDESPLLMDNVKPFLKKTKPFFDKTPDLALNASKINVPFKDKEAPKKDMLYEINEQKYGDDEKFESWGDNNIFFPLARSLMDPMRNIGLTPNHVTYMSTTLTMLSLYYLYIDEELYACIAYFFGYLFDCIDGKMARAYNMGSKFGMALDLVTDNITNFVLISYITSTKGYLNWYTILIVIMSYMISLSYGLNEAIASHKAVGHDNFYNRRKEELQGESGLLYDLFLYINKGTYEVYKFFFGDYNQEKLEEWLKVLKHFGPGNFALFMIFILLNY